MSGERAELSVVVPVYNERENLKPLHAQICAAMERLGRPWEAVYVDDGSTDGSAEELRALTAADPRVMAVRFRRNFGQTAALSAGFELSSGAVVFALDADLQNDPADIPRLLAKLEEGYDLVSGWRRKRRDGFLLRRLPSILANRLIRRLTGAELRDYGCTLKAYRRDLLDNIRLYGEMHRFIPALAHWIGADMAELEVNHRPRTWGRSKYGISRALRVLLDLTTVLFLMNFSTRPIQIFGRLGLLTGFGGFGICAWLTVGKFVRPELYSLNERMPMLMLGILLIFFGAQLVTMGLLGELVTRAYHEAQRKPIYVVREIVRGAKNVESAEASENA